jgi:DNA-binding MltR family transcriptional regulator
MEIKTKSKLWLSNAGVRDVNKVIEEMEKESDRATAILLGAELEDILLQVLTKYFLPAQPKKSTRLLEPDAPIGSFAARIELVYRLGLIIPVAHNELHLIRKIRNEFAHKKAGLTFKSESVSQLISKLVFPKVVDQFILTKSKEDPKIATLLHADERDHFITSGVIILSRLTTLRERIQQIKISRHAKS